MRLTIHLHPERDGQVKSFTLRTGNEREISKPIEENDKNMIKEEHAKMPNVKRLVRVAAHQQLKRLRNCLIRITSKDINNAGREGVIIVKKKRLTLTTIQRSYKQSGVDNLKSSLTLPTCLHTSPYSTVTLWKSLMV